jgi:SAM-dependent methyltransferase
MVVTVATTSRRLRFAGWHGRWSLMVRDHLSAHGSSAHGISGHYARLDVSDDQVSPPEVQAGLRRFLASRPVEAPVLDVGTGVGTNLAVLGEVAPAYGVEVSHAAARSALQVAPVVVGDAARLPFASASIGTAVCTEVLEHVADRAAVFAEIARVLRPGGLAYVTTPNYANLAGLHKLLADRRSGRHDWNPWGAHQGGYEAFVTGRRVWRAAAAYFTLEQVHGLDFGQALTGRFRALDRLAWSRPGQAALRRLLPRMYSSTGRLVWHGMHVELVLRRR